MTTHGQTRLEIALIRIRMALALLTTGLLLAACGSDNAPMTQAQSSDVVVGTAAAGPTPFIGLVPLAGKSLQNVVAYHFVITPRSGAISKPVDVTYTLNAMLRRGLYVPATDAATLPVFGLHAGYANEVSIELIFSDATRKRSTISITTPAYVDPRATYDRPNILKKRTVAGSDLNYFFMKSQVTGPIVVDADGEMRWVAPRPLNAYSTAFSNNGFVIGAPAAVTFTRIELDGTTTGAALASTSYTMFHHNLDYGKIGLFGEFNGTLGGQRSVESALVEFGPTGAVLKEWDLADILGRYMRSQGDDPTPFIRPGIDWFHMNATTYDPRDDSVIVSSRENFVIKVDYRTGDVKWILGDPTKYWYTFPSLRAKALTLDAGGLYPIGQHATSINSAGQLMLFNDGGPSFNQPVGKPVGESRPYSAVSAYDIDSVHMTAHETWRFDYGQTILSDICSSAYEAKAGSILVNYAVANNRTRARLVGLDLARNVMFDFEYVSAGCGTSWNAEPIALEGMTIR